eukprot:scaffold8.g1483.t1
MEDYGFEYDDDEELEEQDVDIENQYYKSKGLLESDELQEALAGFEQVLNMEDGKGEWGFKALKQVIKIQYKLGAHAKMLEAYRSLLDHASVVTRNAAEKKINSVLDHVSQSTDTRLLQDFYSLTLASLAESKNERLWFKTNMKLANLWVSLRELGKAARVLRELHASCQTEDGRDDLRKGTQLLEIYAGEIQARVWLFLSRSWNWRVMLSSSAAGTGAPKKSSLACTQVVLKLIQPYTRVRIPFIARQLNVPEPDVEQLLVSLILDRRVAGRINQVQQLLELDSGGGADDKYAAVDKWAAHVQSLHNAVVAKLAA